MATTDSVCCSASTFCGTHVSNVHLPLNSIWDLLDEIFWIGRSVHLPYLIRKFRPPYRFCLYGYLQGFTLILYSNRAVMKPYVAADHVSSYRSIWFLSSDWIGYHCLCRTAPRRDLFLATLIGHETVFFCTDPCCVRPYGHVFSESRCSCFLWSIVAHSPVFVGPEYFLLFDLLTRFC